MQFNFSVPPAALFNLVAYLYLCAVEPVLLLSGLDDQKPFLMPLRLTSVEGFGPFICRLARSFGMHAGCSGIYKHTVRVY